MALAPGPIPVAGFQWTLAATIALIRQRRNAQQHFEWAANNQHAGLWAPIAAAIGVMTGFVVTVPQCQHKWNALKRGYENAIRIVNGNPNNFPLNSPNRYDRECFNEMSDEFWMRTGI
jgi:hypothetical protein